MEHGLRHHSCFLLMVFFFFSSRRRHTRLQGDWSSDVCSSDLYNGNLRSGVKPLNLTIVLLGNGSSKPIDMLRRPLGGERAANPGVLGERYFSQASLRILLSDNAADITGLDCVSRTAPFNLADLALPVANWSTANATALQTAMTAAGTTLLPLAASRAAGKTVAAGE